ncbi:hypothetical protein EV383_2701 [Pseudonocardia sediminis]|uniref:Uncharacterized protein n=1 Tax=Pseudonocardia sediminis TaxID=1397368 RepID=A0A4Q7V022_PSEST|nr:hypothetical protein EV383_2701 [Pseudonocardia sediminis]
MVTRAGVARGLLVEVQRSRRRDVRSSPGEIEKALAALTRFAASSGELQSEDRAAHRIAQAWLETVRSSLWLDITESADAETLAYRYLCALPVSGCSRGAVRRVGRRHRAALRRWYRCNGTAISIAAARVRAGEDTASDPWRDRPSA